jgi:hypothetical protein
MAPSFLFLAVAVALKCSAFALFQKELFWLKAVAFMFCANIVSSLIGLAVSLGYIMPIVFFIALPIVYFFSLSPAQRMLAYFPDGVFARFSQHGIAAVVTGLLLLTWILFVLGQGAAAGGHYVQYWVLKLGYVYMALTISMGLTTLWEESIVSRLAKQDTTRKSMLFSVTKANLLTYLFIVTAAAVKILPQRLHSPGFLVHLTRLLQV